MTKHIATFALAASVLVLPGILGSQTANVIELTPADAARAQKVWYALQKAQIEWKTAQSDIDARYVHTGEVLGAYGSTTGGGLIKQTIPGFESGFEFSKDFRYIVPKPTVASEAAKPYPWGWGNGCAITVPATGSSNTFQFDGNTQEMR